MLFAAGKDVYSGFQRFDVKKYGVSSRERHLCLE